MPDARQDKRTLLSLKIRYKSATLEDFIERYSSDISRGGVFIKAKKPLAVGTLLKFEFMLQDQSTVIHGVGRVVWRRDEGDAENPTGMGIKFVKMDPTSRSVVQRIAEASARPGVFDQGKDGAPLATAASTDPGALAEGDRTKVRHVSEFLASALEEGGAGEAATREAKAGAERARQISKQLGDQQLAAARGAFSANKDAASQRKQSISDAPARGAMSAFGGAGVSASSRLSSAAAPAMEQFDDDDFLEEETTKVHEHFESDYPVDVDATVIAKEAAVPLAAQRRPTPVMPAPAASSPSLESAVPDLFGPDLVDSFDPAAGEFIDARLLDPEVVTVPPPAAAVPEAPGIPAEAFKVSLPHEPVWTTRPTPPKKQVSRGLPGVIVFMLLLVGGGVAVWQLGFADDMIDLATQYFEPSQNVVKAPAPVAAPVNTANEPSAEAKPSEEPTAVAEAVAVEEAEPSAAAEAELEASAVAEARIVTFQVTSKPNGAFVSVNGKGAGRTPLNLEYAVGTKLSLFSKARGYLARRQQITVEAEQSPVKFALLPLPYVLEVLTSPAGASASAVGGGQVTTPGPLRFKSMPLSRQIVVSMDGYKSATKSVSRSDFTEEPRRMAATINVTLQKDGAPAPEQTKPTAEARPSDPAPEESPPTEVKAEAEAEPPAKPSAPAAPKVQEEAPTPTEAAADDAP